jgi:hypothetical protein
MTAEPVALRPFRHRARATLEPLGDAQHPADLILAIDEIQADRARDREQRTHRSRGDPTGSPPERN